MYLGAKYVAFGTYMTLLREALRRHSSLTLLHEHVQWTLQGWHMVTLIANTLGLTSNQTLLGWHFAQRSSCDICVLLKRHFWKTRPTHSSWVVSGKYTRSGNLARQSSATPLDDTLGMTLFGCAATLMERHSSSLFDIARHYLGDLVTGHAAACLLSSPVGTGTSTWSVISFSTPTAQQNVFQWHVYTSAYKRASPWARSVPSCAIAISSYWKRVPGRQWDEHSPTTPVTTPCFYERLFKYV